MKKGHMAKTAVKGMLVASLMSGGMLAYDSLNNLKGDEDDLKWISEIMEKGRVSLGQGEISIITVGCFLGFMVIAGCIWSLARTNEKEKEVEEKGQWTWQKKSEAKEKEKPTEQPKENERGEKME